MADRTGEQLGNYRLLRLLGRGGFAEVYLGEHIYLKSRAALKILQISLLDDAIELFTREARTLASLNHPHIIRVLEFSVENGVPFLVMEYAPSGTLRQRHPPGARAPTDLVIHYTRQVASALQYAHDQHLIHRDVKPENFLIGSRDEVLLSDFGLATLSPATRRGAGQSEHSTQSMDPSPVGTMSYVAPEQLRGQAQPASDQYSLGVVIYEWLCGKKPFEGSPFEVAMQHVSSPPPSMRELAPGISPTMEEAVMRALAKTPQERFPSVQDFASTLERAYRYVMLPIPTPILRREAQALRPELKPEPMWKVPTAFTQLIGRDREIADICDLLKRPDVRLVTLLGTGGIGKTRLGFQIAREMQPHFADGVCCVLLAATSAPELVIPTIAQTLGIQEIGGQPILEAMKVSLSAKAFLLLLDNFEQIVETAPFLEELLAACPRLKVVVTSRAALNLDAEHAFLVPPLEFPSDLSMLQEESLIHYAAITLFAQRAQAISSFKLTQANAKSVAEICKRLDGLPLAIELAAARMKLLSPASLLAKLAEPLKTLTSQSRSLPQRHQTLRNAIQWSYDLLDSDEQRFFRRLAVFLGGWTVEAVEAIQRAFNEVDTVSVIDRLASLLDNSLLIRSKVEGRQPYIQMLVIVREYALDLLRESGEIEQARRAHALYYLALAEQADRYLKDPQQLNWLQQMEDNQDNLRVALTWCMEQVETGEPDLALRLCGALSWFWYLRGYWSEGRHSLDEALKAALDAMGTTDAVAPRAKALYMAGFLAYQQDEYSQARPLLEESIQMYDRLGMKREYANALGTLGQLTYLQGNLDSAWSMLKESEAICRSQGETWELAASLRRLGYVRLGENDLAQAAFYTQEALASARKLGDKFLLAIILLTLGDIAAKQSDLAEAIARDQEGLAFARALGNKQLIALALQNLGYLAGLQGNLAQATVRTQETLEIMRELGDKTSMTAALHTLGYLAMQRNDPAYALRCFQEGLTIAQQIGNRLHIGMHLVGLAEVALAQDQPRRAAYLFGSAESILDIEADLNTDERAAFERDIEKARGMLGEETFATLRLQGHSMSPEEAVVASEQAPAPRSHTVTHAPSSKPGYPDELTRREVEILRLVATGHTNEEIAGRLVISARTVSTHITTIYRKIKANSRSDATRYAIAHKLVN